MQVRSTTPFEPGTLLNCLTAELVDAAYIELLRSRISGSWLELKLEVWSAVAGTVRKRLDRLSNGNSNEIESDSWRELLLAELTDAAYCTGLRYGLQRPFLDVELGVQRALAGVIERLPVRQAVAARLWRLQPGGNT